MGKPLPVKRDDPAPHPSVRHKPSDPLNYRVYREGYINLCRTRGCGAGRVPGELKHLSNQRKRKQHSPKVRNGLSSRKTEDGRRISVICSLSSVLRTFVIPLVAASERGFIPRDSSRGKSLVVVSRIC